MRYSLSSRFRGILIGTAIGEAVTRSEQTQQSDVWGKMVLSAESLIELGKFDIESRREIFHDELPAAIIAALPVMMFHHENETELRQKLLSLASIWQGDSEMRDGALAIGYAIAQALNEKLQPTTLIGQTIAFLGEPQTQLVRQMRQVQALLEKGAGLEKALNQLTQDTLPSAPIAVAFYCFLNTIEDIRLSVLCAARTKRQPQITAAITGALSGAYNSISGIPTNLRFAPFRIASQPLEVWGIATEAEMLHLSDSLLAVWSGIYDWSASGVGMTPTQAIAAPRVIRLR